MLIGLVEKMVVGPAWKDELKKKEWTSILQTGPEFGKYIETETARISTILTEIGLKK